MLNPNAQIEQLIYTACGKDASGAFGVWSASNDELKRTINNDKIIKAMYTVYEGNKVLQKDINGNPTKTSFDPQVVRHRELKAGATPSGLFKKTYKDSDYEMVETVTRGAIHTIQETSSADLRQQIGYENDFRENEEKAPFRIAYTKLDDGRLLLCRVAAIGSVYSQLDSRRGNLFYHGYIFPAGTEISDIDLSRIDFAKGLDRKYWSEHPEPAPELLPKLTINDLYRNATRTTQARPTQTQQRPAPAPSRPAPAQSRPAQPQQNTNVGKEPQQQPKLLSNDELIELFKKSKLDKDSKVRLQCQIEFSKQVKLGANVPAMINTLYEHAIEKVQNNQQVTSEEQLIIEELEAVNTPFSSIFEHAEKYYDLKQKLHSGDYEYDKEELITENIKISKQYIKHFIVGMDLEKLMEVAQATEMLIGYRAKLNLLQSHGRGSNTLTPMEQKQQGAANMLLRAARVMHEKKLSFDEQRVIL